MNSDRGRQGGLGVMLLVRLFGILKSTGDDGTELFIDSTSLVLQYFLRFSQSCQTLFPF
jgi:hypothetical protein